MDVAWDCSFPTSDVKLNTTEDINESYCCTNARYCVVVLDDLLEWLHPVRFALAYIKMFTIYILYLYFPVVLVMLGDDHN